MGDIGKCLIHWNTKNYEDFERILLLERKTKINETSAEILQQIEKLK